MKSFITFAFFLALQILALCDESPIATTPLTEATLTISQKDSAYPGKEWITRKFSIKNTSDWSFYMRGHSLDHVFVEIHTKDPESGNWVSRNMGYCGTGAAKILTAQNSAFTVTVSLPVEFSNREFAFEFHRTFGLEEKEPGEITKTEGPSMKSKP